MRSLISHAVLLALLLLAFSPLEAEGRRRLSPPSSSSPSSEAYDILVTEDKEDVATAEARRALSSVVKPFVPPGANLKASRVAGSPGAEAHRVLGLPGLPEAQAAGLSQYAGTLQVDANKDGHLFYWLVEKPDKAEEAPLVSS